MTLTFWTSYDKVSSVMSKHVTTSVCDTVIALEKWPLSYQSLELGTKHLPLHVKKHYPNPQAFSFQ